MSTICCEFLIMCIQVKAYKEKKIKRNSRIIWMKTLFTKAKEA